MRTRMLNPCKSTWKLLVRLVGGLSLICILLWVGWRPTVHTIRFFWSQDYRACMMQKRNYELEEKSTPLYVTLKFHGRLGNWMYSYASLLGVARANGYIPYLTTSHPLVSYFHITKVRPEDAQCLYTVFDDLPCTYNPELMNLPAGNISIDGYLQSWKYFRFMEEDVRRELKMHTHLKTQAKEQFSRYVGKYIQEGRLVISIHVRRGDVLLPEARKLGFCEAPRSYLENAMKYMLTRYPHSVFFVASDDIRWCKENLVPVSSGNQTVPILFSESNSYWEDFAMLTLCNHSIISVGTFGWWSAWLANGHVVYYKDSPIPGTKVDYETKKEDFFPPHWVGLSASCANQYSWLLIACLMVGTVLFFNK